MEDFYTRRSLSNLGFALFVGLATFLMELIGSFLTGSLALLSDSFHLMTDVVSVGISYFALRLATKSPTERLSYGFHRAEVLAALINGLSLLIISILIFAEAVRRIITPSEVRSLEMLLIALIGLISNLVMAYRLGSGERKGDLNLMSAFLHVLGDTIASLGVIAASLAIRLTGLNILDPIAGMAIASIISVGSIRVLRGSIGILMEAVPEGIEFKDVAKRIEDIDGVISIHKLHIWSICSNIKVLSAHLVIDDRYRGREKEIIREVEERLRNEFGITLVTLQLQCLCDDETLLRALSHYPVEGDSAF